MNKNRNIRLYVDKELFSGNIIELSEAHSHYLYTVMRCQTGEKIKCFNEKNGEFLSTISTINKKKSILEINKCLRFPPKEGADIWLIFSPLKKDCMDFIIEKSVELGVSAIIPIITQRTNSDRIRLDRIRAQIIEATEQCDRLNVPQVYPLSKLSELISSFATNRILYFMDERRKGSDIVELFKRNRNKPSAILIGPEGGFSDEEADMLNKSSFVKNVSLGPRILRAETAAIASLAIWQSIAGDWHKEEDKK